MENRARKRTRVPDYTYDDGVAERSAKRMKKEPKIEQEPKKEKQIKQKSITHVKKEAKIAIKSEVKSNIKTELKKEKTEKKVKTEHKAKTGKQSNNEKFKVQPKAKEEVKKDEKEKTTKPEQNPGIISRIVSFTKNFLFPDNDEDESDLDPQNEPIPTTTNTNQRHVSVESDSSSSSIESSDSDSESESSEEVDVLFADRAKYNFDSFKTILLPRKKTLKWPKASVQDKMSLNADIIVVIINHCKFPEITIWTRVSKSTSNVVHSAQTLWKKFFRESEWRLPHEIRNKCFFFESGKPIPQLQISDDKVDWFSEFQRNYKTCSKIRRIITKVRREGHDEDPDLKAAKAKIIKWEKRCNYFMPNDMREYYMFYPDHGGILPSLEDLQPFTTDMYPPKIHMNSFYSIVPDDFEEEDEPIQDLDSLSKLLDVPKSKLTEDVYGILYLETGRRDSTVFVPYVNRIYTVEEMGEAANLFSNDATILQDLIKLYKR